MGPVTIQRTTDVHRRFGTDKSVPYEHVGEHPVGRTRQTPIRQHAYENRSPVHFIFKMVILWVPKPVALATAWVMASRTALLSDPWHSTTAPK